jgi:hypothetical protein
MRKRNPQLGWQDFKGRRFSPSLQLGFDAFSGTHNLFLGFSTSEIQPFHPRTYTSNDLIFISPAVKDFPVQTIIKHAGLSGSINLNLLSQINYSLKASSNKLSGNQPILNNFTHLKSDYQLNLEYTKRGEIGYFTGAGLYYRELSTDYSASKKIISSFKTYGGVEFETLGDLDSQAGAEIRFAKNKTAFKVFLNNRLYHSRRLFTGLDISAVQTLPEEKNDLWHWVENGYDVLEQLNINYSFEGKRQKGFKFTADLTVGGTINSHLAFEAAAFYRNFSNYFVEEVTGIYDPDSSVFYPVVHTNTNSSGSVTGFSIGIRNKIYSFLTHSLSYRFFTTAVSDSSFEREWGTIPDHKLIYNVIFSPFESFSLWGNFTFLSPASWYYYPELRERSGNFYSSSLDERFILDFSIRKWFWNNRLRFNLLFKNILNNELQYHPLGARFKLSVFFSAEIVFNSVID